MELRDAWRHHHPYVVNLAYQMPGDLGDAEDVAQQAFTRLSAVDRIDDVRGWLTVVAGRLSLDRIRSAHHRYGLPTETTTLEYKAAWRVPDPADCVTLDDATGDLAALTAVLDEAVWGVATLLGNPAPPPQINHGPHAVGTNLLRYVGPGTTLVAPVGQPVLLGYAQRRLFAVLVLSVRDNRVTKIEATADPSARGFDPRAERRLGD